MFASVGSVILFVVFQREIRVFAHTSEGAFVDVARHLCSDESLGPAFGRSSRKAKSDDGGGGKTAVGAKLIEQVLCEDDVFLGGALIPTFGDDLTVLALGAELIHYPYHFTSIVHSFGFPI
jgi:hypothetical protein